MFYQRGRDRLEFWINKYKLLYIQQKNKDLLYNTGKNIQYLVINIWKESQKNIYITESLFAIHLTLTYNIISQLHFNFKKE